MPFTFIDIERSQSRKIIQLFLTLIVFYFIGMIFLFSAVKLSILSALLIQPGGVFFLKAETIRIFPSLPSMTVLFITSLLAATVHWVFSTKNMINKMLNVIDGKPLDPEDRYHLLLKNIIDEVSLATGGIKIEPYVVSSRDLNAFALSDLNGRSIIGVSEGLLTNLNRNQLESVIAHEAAHLVWDDSLLATVACSISAVYAGLFRKSFDVYNNNLPQLPAQSVPLIFAIGLLRILSLFLSTWISRERETRADATAVRLTRNPLSLAESLYLISNKMRGGFLPSNELGMIFIVNPQQRKLEGQNGFFADLFTTHPPIRQRLDSLLTMAHSDYSLLESSAREKPKPQEEIPLSGFDNNSRWFALNNKIWEGPFRLDGLAQLKWLSPFTWITKEHEVTVRSAYEYKEINEVLNNGPSINIRIHACPACSHDLERVYYEGAPIWRCPFCEGRLVDRDRLSRIIAREEMMFSEEIAYKAQQIKIPNVTKRAKYLEVSQSSLRCSLCGNLMQRTLDRAILPYRVEMDVCHNCNLIWLDQKKLEILQYVMQKFQIA